MRVGQEPRHEANPERSRPARFHSLSGSLRADYDDVF